jgi:hypothetical protein
LPLVPSLAFDLELLLEDGLLGLQVHLQLAVAIMQLELALEESPKWKFHFFR